MIMAIPDGISVDDVDWPSNEVLISCGAEIVTGPPTWVVKIGDRTFCEGLMESEIKARDDEMREVIGEGGLSDGHEITKH